MSDLFNSFVDLFGEDMAISVPEPKKNEKKEEKKEKKPGKKSGKGQDKDRDFDVTLPVTVLGRNFRTVIQGTGSKKVSGIFQELYDAGYLEVKLSGIGAVYTGGSLYLTSSVYAVPEDTAVDFTDGPVTICDGMTHCEVSGDMFDGYDADEISASMLLDKWLEQKPSYAGCRIAMEGNLAYPVFSVNLPDSSYIGPCVLCLNGEERELTEAMTVKDAVGQFIGEIPGVSVYLYGNTDKSHVFADYRANRHASVKKPFTAAKKEPAGKAVQKFPLPLHVRIATWNGEYDLSREDFDGKEKVTEQDIIKYFEPRYRIFSDKSRKLDLIYIEEENLLSLMFISGKKGYAPEYAGDGYGPYELVRTFREFKEALARETFQGNYIGDGQNVRVENLAHGIFLADRDSTTGELVSLDFRPKLPKMPVSILDGIIAYFRNDLKNEAWVKICYNRASGEYFLVKGNPDSAGKNHIRFTMPTDGLIDNHTIIQVMEVHSHNTMPAFFSGTDDADETYPGLYAVIGHLDRKCPDIRVRAGMEGLFKDVRLSDIMEV